MDENNSFMLINVEQEDFIRVSEILSVFSEHGYFDNGKAEVTYKADKKPYPYKIVIGDLKSSKTAWLISDVLEAALGKHVDWFHYSEDPDEEDDE